MNQLYKYRHCGFGEGNFKSFGNLEARLTGRRQELLLWSYCFAQQIIFILTNY